MYRRIAVPANHSAGDSRSLVSFFMRGLGDLGDYAGVFSGGNQQYVYGMKPEDQAIAYSSTNPADIASLLSKYGLTWDVKQQRLYKSSDWLATNNANVQVNRVTGQTYVTPGYSYVDNVATFGVSPGGDPLSLYHLPSGTWFANPVSGALEPYTGGTTQIDLAHQQQQQHIANLTSLQESIAATNAANAANTEKSSNTYSSSTNAASNNPTSTGPSTTLPPTGFNLSDLLSNPLVLGGLAVVAFMMFNKK